MRIGVLSDTHNQLPNATRIVELMNAAGVERVVHTGDITQAKTLEVLARIEAPVLGVYGNNDLERASLEEASARHGISLCDPPLRLAWAERRIVVVHDPRDLDGAFGPEDHVALHGHTHRHTWLRQQERVVFNPGECAGHLPGANAVGVLDLVRLESELLRF